ncbi:pyroglutamyl-peptidase I [Xylanimonas protaetiae]|uniref:Pyroglutamyl-peptidase I n=1 Tax=Xylanimonas protaetiae TaxID=2509457 RepID=A0A4P6F5K0_9MICO|nr:pyroglutamyl-peptidase I [Xylanimonas protaetiae]QAY70894.1 pyroglutamyl-peptidase I [Xylanimonas protaetiae]
MTTALVTGFEPFGGDAVNASWEAVRSLTATWDDDAALVPLLLPVTFDGAAAALTRAVADHRPDVVVAVGLASGTTAVRLERVAVNVVDARIPDNAGAQPVDVPVVDGGPTAYLSTLPLKGALAALGAAGVPAVVSNTAGTYVCNAAFYALRHATEGTGARAGFVHVPALGDLAADRSDAAALADALRVVVRTALAAARGEAEEPVVAAGAEH